VEVLDESPDSPCTYHVFPVRVSRRDQLAVELTRAGIATRIHYPLALPDQPALQDLRPTRPVATARDWARRELSLPIFPGMRRDEVESVVEVVNGHGPERDINRHVKRGVRIAAGQGAGRA
jgi:dTDP-4-amino-4,6-dideoxygalactose transaminase